MAAEVTAEVAETEGLIGSDKVEGTSVFDKNGEKIGSVERVMFGKKSGKVAYAVLSFGGILGLGDHHYPLPWSSLNYDETLGGYRTQTVKAQLENAPKYATGAEWNWEDKQLEKSIDDYYALPYGGEPAGMKI